MQNNASDQPAPGSKVGSADEDAGALGPGAGEVGPRKAAAIAAFHAPVLAAGIVGRVELAPSAVGGFASFLLLAAGAAGVGFGLWQILLWALERLDAHNDRGSAAVG